MRDAGRVASPWSRRWWFLLRRGFSRLYGRPFALSTRWKNGQPHASKRIVTPWKHRWRRLRSSTLPVLCFVVSAALVLRLWQYHCPAPQAVGEVEAVSLCVAAESDGIVRAVEKSLYETVQQGQIVAVLDDRPLRANLATQEAELERCHRAWEAAAMRIAIEEADRQRRHACDLAALQNTFDLYRLSLQDRQNQMEADRLQLQGHDARLKILDQLVAGCIEPELKLVEERLQRETVARRLSDNQTAMRHVASDSPTVLDSSGADYAFQPLDREAALAPLALAVKVQEARLREIQLAIDRLTVKAPIRGTISEIRHWPGESVRAGEPILKIVPAESQTVICYVRQETRLQPHVGTEVLVRGRLTDGARIAATVQEVGPYFEPVPPHQLRDPRLPEWGLPVRIAVPHRAGLRPGELVDVTFPRRLGRTAW